MEADIEEDFRLAAEDAAEDMPLPIPSGMALALPYLWCIFVLADDSPFDEYFTWGHCAEMLLGRFVDGGGKPHPMGVCKAVRLWAFLEARDRGDPSMLQTADGGWFLHHAADRKLKGESWHAQAFADAWAVAAWVDAPGTEFVETRARMGLHPFVAVGPDDFDLGHARDPASTIELRLPCRPGSSVAEVNLKIEPLAVPVVHAAICSSRRQCTQSMPPGRLSL